MNHFIVEWDVNYSDICVKNILNYKNNVKIPLNKLSAKLIVELETKFIDKMFEMAI